MDFDLFLREKCRIHLNPQQREAVLTTEGPVLLLAVPGSGKTTVVAARTAYMVMARGIPAESILTLTFNRSAKLDMEARYQSLFGGEGAAAVRFATIHSFCNSVLRQYGELVGRQVPKLIEDGKARLLRQIHGQFNGPEYLPDDRLEELTNAIGFAKNRMMTNEEIRDGKWGTRNFPAIFDAYESYKNENGCMDFDDMLDKALAAFRVRPVLLERFRNLYRYVSVDEAQDVSRLQHEIIRMLAAPANNLFMVGDEDQSIYGFRAASPEYLLRFERDFPGAKVLLMERNYRSTSAVVTAANRLIKKNAARRPKNMASGGDAGPAVVETMLADSGQLPGHIVARLKAAEDPGKFAVLFRENGSAVALMDALDRAGIPFRVREHRADFFSHRVVRDILAFLSLARDPMDMVSLRQIYWKMGAGVSRDQFDGAAARLAQGGCPSALDALLAAPDLKEAAVKRLTAVQQGLAALGRESLRDSIPFILNRLYYRDHLRKSFGEGSAMQAALHMLDSMNGIIGGVEGYDGLLGRIAYLSALTARAGNGTGVTLSTVHSAKGLEFDSVIVMDLYDGRFPSGSSIAELDQGNPAPMEEERRLFYVAITRARREVELITAAKVFGDKAKLSRFIREAVPSMQLRRALESHMKKSPVVIAGPDIGVDGEPRTVEVGMEIHHSHFGAGVVTMHDAGRGVVSVRFPKYGVKVIAEEFCRSGDHKPRPWKEEY